MRIARAFAKRLLGWQAVTNLIQLPNFVGVCFGLTLILKGGPQSNIDVHGMFKVESAPEKGNGVSDGASAGSRTACLLVSTGSAAANGFIGRVDHGGG